MFDSDLPFESPYERPNYQEFKIEKLFNKYDVTINLQDKCFVLIGPNGIGKSTVMRLFYNFLSGNLVECVAVPFKKISIKCNNTEWSYQYSDFFPSVESAVKVFEKYLAYATFNMSDYENYRYKSNNGITDTDTIKKCFEEIYEKNLWGQFYYLSYKEKDYPLRIENIFKKAGINPVIFKTLKLTDVSFDFYNASVFTDSALFNYYEELGRIPPFDDHPANVHIPFTYFDRNCCYFDMVQSYSLENKSISDSIYSDSETDWAYSDLNELERHPDLKRAVNCKEYDESIFHDSASIFTSSHSTKIKEEARNQLVSEHKLNINRLINATIYPQEIVLNVNNTASEFATSLYEEYDKAEKIPTSDFGEPDEEFVIPVMKKIAEVNRLFTPEIKDDYMKYIHPILVKNSLFSVDLNDETYSRVNPEVYENGAYTIEDLFDPLLGIDVLFTLLFRRKLYDFIQKVLPALKDPANISSEVATYENMLKRYLKDKYVSVCPAGIIIKDSVFHKDGENRIILYDEEEIDLSVISSGERKIIILFAVAIFLNDMFIMLDEPELSLSLVWQEMLLPDLLEYGAQKKISVSTHSPYIVQNEKVRPFIIYLPQQED